MSKNEEYEITSYCKDGKDHFSEWFKNLTTKTQDIVLLRLARVKSGNFGDCKHIAEKIYELRIHYGAGYRIYLTKEKHGAGQKIVILLCAGDKSSQSKDIKKVKLLLANYLEKKLHNI